MKPLVLMFIFAVLSVGSMADAAEVVRGRALVVDGDTLEIDGRPYRLFGIDAPEAAQVVAVKTGGRDFLGRGAALMLRALVRGTQVRCVVSAQKDGRGVTLATCTSDDRDIGAEMVETGMALAVRSYPSPYGEAEARARAEKRGFWRDDVETPWAFRTRRAKEASASAPGGCVVKAKVLKETGRTLFVPWSPWYARATIDPAKGDRWFCSEAEAVADGWKEPRWLMMSVVSGVYDP